MVKKGKKVNLKFENVNSDKFQTITKAESADLFGGMPGDCEGGWTETAAGSVDCGSGGVKSYSNDFKNAAGGCSTFRTSGDMSCDEVIGQVCFEGQANPFSFPSPFSSSSPMFAVANYTK
jgi:hypothetical protein